MSDNSSEDMEKLSRAIVEAITGSEDVRQALKKMQKLNDAVANNFMVFMVKLDSLSDNQNGKNGIRLEEIPGKRLKKRKAGKKSVKPFIVDGKVISENEKVFLDYISKNFDQKAWLEKNKLRLE